MTTVASTTVPEGHRVTMHRGALDPSVVRCQGGLVLACSGPGGDDTISEMRALLADVARTLGSDRVILSQHVGPLASLFAPGDPPVTQVDGAVAMHLQTGSLAGWTEDAARIDEIATALRDLSRRAMLTVYVDRGDDVPATRLVPILRGLGIDVRHPASDGATVIEVHRPEGAIATALAGEPVAATAREIADAEAGPEPEVAEPPSRAPKMKELVLALAQGRGDVGALLSYLATRRRSLALVATKAPDGRIAIAPRSWPGLGPALPVYGDTRTLHRAAKDVGLAEGSYGLVAMPPAKLYAWATSTRLPIMLCAYDDAADVPTPYYVPLALPELQALVS